MTLEDIRADFALLDDWEDRYRYVIELGRALPPLPEELRNGDQQGPRLRQPGLDRDAPDRNASQAERRATGSNSEA